ncbi:FGGY carbohydrate kinase domain-containing protein [Danio rerio]|uniref:FGGY carbohydrate kinase domain-containing protein n=1 Tax=Danio rerio TaxID=7955 RepID=FGGY_DANRE|nr:FGGY carbohydrate kinase domain-containing protein [Danio rerio]Q6NUW9.2 RecName: Full=FGGY carbohydrate kinase domain-containing protein [Danio rerio]|eukprot:NP_998446.2 FGGY carbohydrate kinase domain-containing protein [Danio rerio]
MGSWYYVGVDVGSASVRAALVSPDGQLRRTAEEPIAVHEPCVDHYEQSSTEIWSKCCQTVKRVTEGVDAACVRGIGFDGTCSLVVLDQQFRPLAVNLAGVCDRNVVMWMDHRAAAQASRITACRHTLLQRVGGVMSPEIQPPKLLWLKENLPDSCWTRAAHFFDLPDFLSWKATGSLSRSLCTLVCKWTYSASEGWDDTFWSAIGLEDLIEDSYARIGSQVCCPGAAVGRGLTAAAAADLGLNEGTAVGASLIDAHAGGIGVLGADVSGLHLPCEHQPLTARMALICGTSSCHMAVSREPLLVPGVWGPYLSAMLPGLWLNEGGQSATGKLLDHVVKGHAAFRQLEEQAEHSGRHIYTQLNLHLQQMSTDATHLEQLTTHLHIWPDFHGNRSPLADQTARGTVVGLSLSQTLDDLALLYLATLQALALGSRHIIAAMTEAGHDITTLFLCGGLSKNTLFVQTHANTTGLPVVLPAEREAVLLGAAVIGACASSDCTSIPEAMRKMSRVGRVVRPNPELQSFYRRKYSVFLRLYQHQKECVSLMED